MEDFNFKVEKEVQELGVKGIYFTMRGMSNAENNADFEAVLNEIVKKKIPEVTPEWIEKNNILVGFRELHTKINRSNRKFISSSENLYYTLARLRTIPRINLIVDIYNLLSVKYGLALGSHDLSKIEGDITLRLTKGDEIYIPLGQKDTKPVQKGDYSYIDDSNEIICHMEVRQVEKTKIVEDTTDAFYIVQGNRNTSDEYLNLAATELIDLTKKYCGGCELILSKF